MSDELNLNTTPELTFEPSAAQAVEAPALTLEPSAPAAPQVDEAAQAARDANAVKLDESMLSEAEKKMVEDFSQKIDVTDSNLVLNYGAAAQKNIAAFSESALNNVKTKDLGEVGEALSSLVVELKTFGQPEKKGIGGFFQKKRNELEAMKASYTKAEVNVDKIVKVLQDHQVTLMKDVAMFDQMYELNTKYYKELTMYILAGKKRLEYLRAHGSSRPYVLLYPDGDAVYERSYVHDAAALAPQVACPHHVDNVHDVTQVAGAPLTQVYIGSCTGGRLSDLRAAAHALKGRKAAKGLRFLVSPASREVYRAAMAEGLLDILTDAGAVIVAPSCGLCLGAHTGILAGGESCISTSNRNFIGKGGTL